MVAIRQRGVPPKAEGFRLGAGRHMALRLSHEDVKRY